MSVWRHAYFWPSVLIVLGIYFMLRNFKLLDWLDADIVWPVLLIILGVWLILRRTRP
jgi:phage shock protein C